MNVRSASLLATLLGVFVLLAALPARVSQAAPIRVLVAAGNNAGLAEEPLLRYAAGDAKRIYDLFIALGSVRPSNARLLQNAGLVALVQELKQLRAAAASRRPAETELFVYYSGHGDDQAVHADGERLALTRLQALIDAVPARLRVLVIDACRSVPRGKGVVRAERFAISLDPLAQRGTVLLQSAAAGQLAQESEPLRGAVFTHYLSSGMRGAADRDDDRRVTLAEAYVYAYNRTIYHSAGGSGPLQHPTLALQLRGSGPVVLTHLDRARSRLVLPSGADVQYLIYRRPGETLVAEAWGRSRRPAIVALPAGRFVVVRRGTGAPGAIELWLPYGGERRVSNADFVSLPEQVLSRKGANLSLRRHELQLGYEIFAGQGADLGHRASLRYGYRLAPDWVLLAGLGIDTSRHETDLLDITEYGLAAEILAQWRYPLGEPGNARLSGGLAARLIWQHREHHEAERLRAAGYAGSYEPTTALGLGPLLGLGWALPVWRSWWMAIDVFGDSIALHEAHELRVRLGGRIQLSVFWEG